MKTEEIHHKLPLSQGGTHEWSNLIALCRSCHAKIHAENGDRCITGESSAGEGAVKISVPFLLGNGAGVSRTKTRNQTGNYPLQVWGSREACFVGRGRGGERNMAKDGTMRGGARVGSGRKSKALTEKIGSGLAASVIDLPSRKRSAARTCLR